MIRRKQDPDGAPDLRYLRSRGNRRVRKARMARATARWLGVAAVQLGVLAALSLGLLHAVRVLSASSEFRVDAISLVGVRAGDAAAIRRDLEALRGRNIAGLELDDVAAGIERHPWVESAAVRRVLPGTLAVVVRERRPAALAVVGGVVRIVDTTGRCIAPLGPGDRYDLPVVTGLDALPPEAAEGALRRATSALLRLHALRPDWTATISEIDVSQPDRLAVVTIGGGPVLWLDPERAERNLQPFLALSGEIEQRVGAARYVDLRWRDRISVLPEPGAGS